MRRYTPFVSKEAEYNLGRVTFSNFCAPNDLELLAMYDETELTVGFSVSQDLIIIRGGHKTCPVDAYNRQDQPDRAKQKLPVLSISAVLDSGERMRIYGDQLCSDLASTFVHVQSLAQLDLEEQTASEFCELWIKNLKLVK